MKKPVTITVTEAAELLGVSAAGAYRAIHDGTFPVNAIKIGKGRWVIPRAPLMELLGIGDDPAEG